MSKVKLTLPVGEVPVNGKQVTFTAPCPCYETEAIQIDGVDYTICDAMGRCVTGKGGVWNVGEIVSVILNTETRKAFLQSTVMDFSSGNAYVWEKVKMTTTVTPSLTGSGVYVSLIAMTPDANATGSLTYAESIDMSRNLINPKTVSFSLSNYSHVSSVLANAFFIDPSDSSQVLYCDGTPEIEFYSEEFEDWIDEDENGEPEDIIYGIRYSLSIQSGGVAKKVSSVTVSGSIDERHGYVSSLDPDAYPVDDGFTYLARGQVGGLGRVVTGSYVGTGTYGATNKNSLTFDFQPKIVFVTVGHHDQFQKSAMFVYGQSEATVINNGGTAGSSQGHISLEWFGNGVAWWDGYHNGDGAPPCQLNGSGLTYYYTAIG